MDEAAVWVVLVRHLPIDVEEADSATAFAAMVLDRATGLIRGVALDLTQGSALRSAMSSALTTPAHVLPPVRPSLVLCCGVDVGSVRGQLAKLLPRQAMPPTRWHDPIDEAEDIFDSMLGHLAGQDQPEDDPSGDDWRALMAATVEYARTEPWLRWPDDEMAELQVTVDGAMTYYLASVIGASGVQRGLNLFPGRELPILGSVSGMPVMPPGTLIVWLDDWDEDDPTYSEVVRKAGRYGWPDDMPLVPTYLGFGPTGPTELSRTEVRQLTVAVGAVVTQSRRSTAPPVGRARRGTVPVDLDTVGSYTLRLVR
jgi:hypothetical protein